MCHSSSPLPLIQDVRPLLRTERFGRPLESHASIDSTNRRAAHWAAEGAAEGSVVVAEFQTAGRGRQGRAWSARAGQNLMCSVVLRPRLPAERLSLVTLAASVAVADAVAAVTAPLMPAIKWPNDVLLNGRKCCGMLLESSIGHPTALPRPVILGIGLNVNQDSFPSDVAAGAACPPTSLLLETGRAVPRAALLARLLAALEAQYASLLEDDGTAVRAAYEARLAALGTAVTLRRLGTGARVTGTVRGVTPTGALRLDTARGPRTFVAGEVTFGKAER